MVEGLGVPDYRSYLISLAGSILAANDLACADDEAAIAKAKALYHPHTFEVWLAKHRIYPPSAAGLSEARELARAVRE
jgi:hypothetical protein